MFPVCALNEPQFYKIKQRKSEGLSKIVRKNRDSQKGSKLEWIRDIEGQYPWIGDAVEEREAERVLEREKEEKRATYIEREIERHNYI